jgi:hypothetical protein
VLQRAYVADKAAVHREAVSSGARLGPRRTAMSMLLLQLLALSGTVPNLVGGTAIDSEDNPNCISRGKCTTVGPGTKYPEQVRHGSS